MDKHLDTQSMFCLLRNYNFSRKPMHVEITLSIRRACTVLQHVHVGI
jgi:hypothetical protein